MIADNDLPYILEDGDDILRAGNNEGAIVKVVTDGFWVLESNEGADIVEIDSYYYYRRR